MVLDWIFGSNDSGPRIKKTLPFVRKFTNSDNDRVFNDNIMNVNNLKCVSTNEPKVDGVQAKTSNSLDTSYKVSFNDGIIETWIANSRKKALALCCCVTTVVLGTYVLRRSSKKAAQYFRQKWGRPVLVRETSVISVYETIKHPITTLKNIKKRTKPETFLKNLIFSPEVKTKYIELLDDFLIRRRTQDPFRNLFIYGPPGNGKSLLAKKLALDVGMDYLVMSGTDLAPLGHHMPTQMQEMFQWIQKHKAPILLIVDEADVFLGKRDKEDLNVLRAAMDVFFKNTANPSNTLALSLVANDPTNIDREVYYRMDDIVKVTLPDETLREQLLRFFITKHMTSNGSHSLLLDLSSKVTSMTDTMSCRDIEKLVMSWNIALENTPDPLGRRDQILKYCLDAVEQQNFKNLLLGRKKEVTKFKSSVINTLADGHLKNEEVSSTQEDIQKKPVAPKSIKGSYSDNMKKISRKIKTRIH